MRAWLPALVLVCSCGGDDGPATIDARIPDAEVPDAAFPTGTVSAEVMNFNVGLLQTVLGSTVRLPEIITAVNASSAEVICFEEVWTQYTTHSGEADKVDFSEAIAEAYPYQMWDWTDAEDGTGSSLGNGLLIASKYPLHRQRYLRYTMNDNIVDRGVLAATVVKDDDWHLNVVCTHLQAGLDGGDQDPPPVTSNAGIRAAQLVELEQFVTDNGYDDGPSVLLGDFNAGPDPDPTDDECPGQAACPATCTPADNVTVAEAVMSGWTDRADDLGFTECTYCAMEADALEYIPLYPCEGSQRIDHCLTRGTAPAQITAIVRDMENAIDVAVPGDSMNRHVNTLSDHYAVRCTIE